MQKPLSFSLREILGLTLVAALLLGWYLDHRKQASLSMAHSLDANKWRNRCIVVIKGVDDRYAVSWDDSWINVEAKDHSRGYYASAYYDRIKWYDLPSGLSE